jgi:hypothetical protein
MYIPIQQRSEDVGDSVAHFCHEAAIGRAVLGEARRGYNWRCAGLWKEAFSPKLDQTAASDDTEEPESSAR